MCDQPGDMRELGIARPEKVMEIIVTLKSHEKGVVH